MPDFRRADAMPVRDLTRTQQVIDRRRISSSVWARVIAKGLAVEATLGMRLQVEHRDDLICRHEIAPSAVPALVDHHGADGFSFVHQVERIIDAFKREFVGDEVVDSDSALHIPIDNFWNIGAASCAAERRALPDAAGDELERPRRDLLTGAGNANDDADAPTLVAALQRLTHGLHIADAFEAVIRAAAGERDQMRHDIAAYFVRIDEIRHAEFLRQRAPRGIEIDADDLRRA